MVDRSLRILQVSPSDSIGGGHIIPWNLFRSYRARGYSSWMAVGRKLSRDSDVLKIPNRELQGGWCRFWLTVGDRLKSFDGRVRGAWRVGDLARGLAEPRRWLDEHRGFEDFHFPGSRQLLTLAPKLPDIVHFHNLHGGYFDLEALPRLSRELPVVLTLHDAWLLSGHCAHSFDCERWKIGCGHCPDLNIYPAIRRDATAYNWRRKRDIYAQSRMYVSTPSEWLMRKVEQSVLAPAVVEARVIPNGMDLSVFHPADKQAVRVALGIPQDTRVLLFIANGIRRNIWKDYQTMRTAIALFSERFKGRDILFIALGEDAPAEPIGQAEVRFVPYQKNAELVARYYQAADLYLHAARAETFPNTVLEALACGIPVVATAVGGIPEQVKGLEAVEGQSQTAKLNRYDKSEATGILVPAGDAAGMAVGIERLLEADLLRHQMSENAAKDARERFDLERQVDDYLEWYEELAQHAGAARKIAAGIC
jgi:glycosyltransferase involved in cell wall biosynthesis